MAAKRSVIALVVAVAVSFGAGLVGSVFTARSVGEWYAGLARPAWTPPSWVFGPVWSALYLLMGVAAWVVWRKGGFAGQGGALALFGAQLVLNAAWSWLFFGMRAPGAAFAEIVILWALILATLIAFWRAAPLAGLLFLPYLIWVTFASALNFAIWRLNS